VAHDLGLVGDSRINPVRLDASLAGGSMAHKDKIPDRLSYGGYRAVFFFVGMSFLTVLRRAVNLTTL
jgi:hypothetical protein